jgi:hypothetical protein
LHVVGIRSYTIDVHFSHLPVFIAVWVPFTLGTLTKPAEQPIKAPPGK